MVRELRRGENVSITGSGSDPRRIEVGVGWEVDAAVGTLDVEVFALLLGADAKVVSDAHLVFYNNDASPEGAVRLSGHLDGGVAGDDRQRLTLDLAGMPPEVDRVVVAVAVYDEPGQDGGETRTLSGVRGLFVRVLDADLDARDPAAVSGTDLVRFAFTGELEIETAVQIAEVYRRGEGWKVVAVGQGYASGLRGVATEYGVHV